MGARDMIETFAIIGLAALLYVCIGLFYAVYFFGLGRQCQDEIPTLHFISLIIEWPLLLDIINGKK